MPNADTWLSSPSLKNKPRPPALTLPSPKRKSVAALVVAVPAFIGLAVGILVALFLRWLGSVIQGGFGGLVAQTWVFILIVTGLGVIGAYVGIRSLMVVLTYGALERAGKTSVVIQPNNLKT